jgi:hypothetical protein
MIIINYLIIRLNINAIHGTQRRNHDEDEHWIDEAGRKLIIKYIFDFGIKFGNIFGKNKKK